MDERHATRPEGQDGGHADSRAAPAFVPGPLGPDGLRQIDAYWRAANYL